MDDKKAKSLYTQLSNLSPLDCNLELLD